MLTIFFLMVKTRGSDKQKHLRISGTSATFKLTDSMILCVILSLSVDKHQISCTHTQNWQAGIKRANYQQQLHYKHDRDSHDKVVSFTSTIRSIHSYSHTHTPVPISPADRACGTCFRGHYYNDLNATFSSFFLLFDFIRKFCSLLDLERDKSSWNKMQEKGGNKWILKSRTP